MNKNLKDVVILLVSAGFGVFMWYFSWWCFMYLLPSDIGIGIWPLIPFLSVVSIVVSIVSVFLCRKYLRYVFMDR